VNRDELVSSTLGSPREHGMARGWAECSARSHPAKPLASESIPALACFFEPTSAIIRLASTNTPQQWPGCTALPRDVDAGALLRPVAVAPEAPDDTSLTQEHKAMVVLTPCVHEKSRPSGWCTYVIHACDTPSSRPRTCRRPITTEDRRVVSPCRAACRDISLRGLAVAPNRRQSWPRWRRRERPDHGTRAEP